MPIYKSMVLELVNNTNRAKKYIHDGCTWEDVYIVNIYILQHPVQTCCHSILITCMDRIVPIMHLLVFVVVVVLVFNVYQDKCIYKLFLKLCVKLHKYVCQGDQ